MTLSPSVSVVIPAYKAEKTIARAIRSVLCQTYSDFEILVVDNASNDDTRDIVLEISARDSRVIYIHSEKNLGPAEGRNLAINQARGDFIAFLDADDAWELNSKLAEQVAALEKHANVGLIFSDCDTFDAVTRQRNLYSSFNKIHSRDIRFVTLDSSQNYFLLDGNVSRSLYGGNFICISTVVVRKSALDQVKSFTPLLFGTEDIDLWVRLSAAYTFCYWNKSTICYFWQETSISRITEKRIKELIKYHLYCKESRAYSSMQDLVIRNLEYCYKLQILEYSQRWRPFEAIHSYYEAQKQGVKSLRLLFYVLASFFGPIPLFVKLNIINRASLKLR